MTQYSLQTGLKHSYEKGKDTVTVDLDNPHNMHKIGPLPKSYLSKHKQKETVRLLIFLKHKQDQLERRIMVANVQKKKQQQRGGCICF